MSGSRFMIECCFFLFCFLQDLNFILRLAETGRRGGESFYLLQFRPLYAKKGNKN